MDRFSQYQPEAGSAMDGFSIFLPRQVQLPEIIPAPFSSRRTNYETQSDEGFILSFSHFIPPEYLA
jgi:hypothetical protein